ncbi:MAG: DUF4175 family protein [Candidatus Eisenbacteria bacterium]
MEQAYRAIRGRLTAIRNRIAGVEATIFLGKAAFAALLLLLLNVLAGWLLPSRTFLRVAAVISLGALLAWIAWALAALVRRWPRLRWIAAEAERATPDLKGDLLRGALDLGRRSADSERFGYSPALIEALVADALRKSDAIRERTLGARNRIRRALPAIPLALLAAVFLFAVVPHRTAGVVRALAPSGREAVLAEVGLQVSPGDCTVEAGETVPVTASFTEYAGKGVHLLTRSGEEEWRAFPMAERRRSEGRLFEGEIPALEADAEYRIRFDNGESPSFRVAVHRPPMMTGLAYRLRFPPYTGLEDLPVRENHGNVTALYGSEVFLEGETNLPVAEAWLAVEGREKALLAAEGRRVHGSFVVDGRFSYEILLVDSSGAMNADPVRYEVMPVEDEKPFVRITHPGENVDLDQEMALDIRFTALDDYGVRSVNLVYRVGEEDERKIALFSTADRITGIERLRPWDLSDIRLLPQDVITYYLEAWDNDDLRGPNRGVSRTYQVRMPSLAEIFQEVTGDRETEIAELEDLYDESRDLEETLDELSREIRRNEEISWDEKKKIENVLDKQKEIEESLRDVASEIDRTTDKLEESRLITPETVERMMELSRLLSEVATDEMRQALQDLQAAMRDLKPEEIQAAAENLELTQQDFMERLDRAIEMLKRLKDLQDTDALAEALQRMAEEQRSLRERTENVEANSEEMNALAEEEDALREELDRTTEELEELAERSEENSPSLAEQLRQAMEELEKRKTNSKMEQSADNMRQGKKSAAQQKQQEAENDLFDLSFRLTETVSAMCSSASQRSQAAFGESIQDLIYLSKGQEGVLVDATGDGRSSSLERRRDLAEKQQEVWTGIGRVMEKIREVGKDSPHLSSMALDLLRRGRGKAEQAASEFEAGRMDLARARGDEAMIHLNRSIVELLRSQENQASSCSNPNGQSQGMQQMQRMTDRQRGLNQESSQVPMPSNNPAAIPMETRAQMSRLAAEQQQIRKGVEQLQQEVEEGGDVLGRLDDIMEEMRGVEKDLDNANLSPETRERQERILSRMLDAQRSIRDRGYRKDRRSRTGEAVEAGAPDRLPRTLSEARERMREDAAHMPGFVYPPEYEELIRSYYRALEAKD